jgi:hypothetical protein
MRGGEGRLAYYPYAGALRRGGMSRGGAEAAERGVVTTRLPMSEAAAARACDFAYTEPSSY